MQVVARVHKGMDMLPRLNALPVDKDDQPTRRVTITACGISDAQASACGNVAEQAASYEAVRMLKACWQCRGHMSRWKRQRGGKR